MVAMAATLELFLIYVTPMLPTKFQVHWPWVQKKQAMVTVLDFQMERF